MNGCPCPDLCHALGQHIHGRRYEIWTGEFTSRPLPYARAQEYRRRWAASASTPLEMLHGLCPWEIEVEEPPLPPTAVMMQNAVSSGLKFAAAGMPIASPEEQERRMALCLECPKFRKSDERCSVCGCGMKLKASWLTEKCPEGKW